MKVSYECEDLINELKKDILEFGNIDLYAFFEELNGYIFITNYDFIDDEMPLNTEELRENTIVKIMKVMEILEILKEQNRIV